MAAERQVDSPGQSAPNPTAPLLHEYLETSQLAAELHRTIRTIDRLILSGDGPPYVRIGNKKYFRRTAVLEWLRERETPVRSQGKRKGVQ